MRLVAPALPGLTVLCVLLTGAQAQGEGLAAASVCEPARQTVTAVFDALDRRDVSRLEDIFVDGATVTHDNGMETDVRQAAAMTLKAPQWPDRRRTLSEWRFNCLGDVAIVTLRNDVTFSPTDAPVFSRSYRESWVVRRVGQGWRAVHGHYTRVEGR